MLWQDQVETQNICELFFVENYSRFEDTME